MASSQASQLKIIYVLYLVGLVAGITPIIGVVIAYMGRGGAEPWLSTHYTYAIRTFWIGLLYVVIASILTVVVIGFVLLLAVAVWYIVRCVKGLLAVDREQAIENPQTWMV